MSRRRCAVTELPNHWCASSWAMSRSLDRVPSQCLVPKIEMPCASSGYIQRVVGDDDRVAAAQGILAEQVDEQFHHLGSAGEIVVEAASQPPG